MLNWNNLDTLASYQELEKAERINLAAVSYTHLTLPTICSV